MRFIVQATVNHGDDQASLTSAKGAEVPLQLIDGYRPFTLQQRLSLGIGRLIHPYRWLGKVIQPHAGQRRLKRFLFSIVVGEIGEMELALLDKRARLEAQKFADEAAVINLDIRQFDAACSSTTPDELLPLQQRLEELGVNSWCRFDPTIVRGLAYYTGMVFEVHETSGKERAIAGGGRYDNLVELFGESRWDRRCLGGGRAWRLPQRGRSAR